MWYAAMSHARRRSTRALQVFTEGGAGQLADRAFLCASTGTESLCQLGVYAYLHTGGGAGLAERGPSDALGPRPAQVVAPFSLVGQSLDPLLCQLRAGAGSQSRHLAASLYCDLYLSRRAIAWITNSSPSDSSTAM